MWPYRVNFTVSNYEPFEDLEHCEQMPENLEPYFVQCMSLEDMWMTQTFIFLKSAGYPVTLRNKLVPNEICFVESSSLSIKQLPFRSYIVACRADRPRSRLSDQSTVMNKLAVHSDNEHHIYSWPQPIITKRAASRGTKVETVDFKGNVCNLWEPFRSKNFTDKLMSLGIKLQTSTEEHLSGADLYKSWGNYSNSDVLLAVRNLTEYDFSIKPELKLTNAWRAGVPAILGPEPAFQALRRSELDYIEVRSVEETVAAIQKLKNNPALYKAMVENGIERAKEFSVSALTQYWVDLIEGPVFRGYETWKTKGFLYSNSFRLLDFAVRAIRQKQETRSHMQKIRNGPRPLNF